MLLNYEDARKFIKEGDILLFRGTGLISFLLARFTGGVHTHAAVAHWDDDTLECIEFREFKGARTVALRSQVDLNPEHIDVFRPLTCVSYDELVDGKIQNKEVCYTDDTAKKVVKEVLLKTGQEYGWKNIFNMFLRYVPFVRLRQQNMDDESDPKTFVCSTAVVYALRKHYVDPVEYVADSMVSPADLARTPLLHYLFTLRKDW